MDKKKKKEKLIEIIKIDAYSPTNDPTNLKPPPMFKTGYANRNSALNKAKKNE